MFENLKLPQDIQCGMVLPAQNRADMLRLAPRMEVAGFDSIWVGDHVSFYIPLLPLRHPTPVAKITSTLDLLSGGRLTLGVGVGGEFPPEFEACGVPLEERGPRIDEAIEVLRTLWTEDRAEHRGKHFSFGPVSLDPKPLQKGGPPILIGGRKGPTFRRAGQHGDGYISHMCSAQQYARRPCWK